MPTNAEQARDLAAAELGGKLARIHHENATAFTVYGWPFAIIRNGADAWDLLGPRGLDEALSSDRLGEAIREQVEEAAGDNAHGWNDPPQIDWTEGAG